VRRFFVHGRPFFLPANRAMRAQQQVSRIAKTFAAPR